MKLARPNASATVEPALPGHRWRPPWGLRVRGSKPACAGLDGIEELPPPAVTPSGSRLKGRHPPPRAWPDHTAVRTISDRADDAAHGDFALFVQTVASRYAEHMVQTLLQKL